MSCRRALHGSGSSAATVPAVPARPPARSNENLLVCAPTGAGKTNIAMIAVLREIGANMVHGIIQKGDFKVRTPPPSPHPKRFEVLPAISPLLPPFLPRPASAHLPSTTCLHACMCSGITPQQRDLWAHSLWR
jgi:hypothetical protein